MRYFILILCGFLAGCYSQGRKEYTVIREVSRPVQSVKTETVTQPNETVYQHPITEVGYQQPLETVVVTQPMPSIPPYYATLTGEQVVYYQEMPLMGEMIVGGEVSVEQIPTEQPVQPVVQPAAQTPIYENQVSITQDMEHCVVVLQHPQGRDLVRCMNTDLTCIQSYEKLGYVQLRYTPHFAGSKDVEMPSDYPARRWRSNNNIPRW